MSASGRGGYGTGGGAAGFNESVRSNNNRGMKSNGSKRKSALERKLEKVNEQHRRQQMAEMQRKQMMHGGGGGGGAMVSPSDQGYCSCLRKCRWCSNRLLILWMAAP